MYLLHNITVLQQTQWSGFCNVYISRQVHVVKNCIFLSGFFQWIQLSETILFEICF